MLLIRVGIETCPSQITNQAASGSSTRATLRVRDAHNELIPPLVSAKR